ncbi:MAG: hypothetical protein ABJP34_03840 [Erythrobacter sp.]
MLAAHNPNFETRDFLKRVGLIWLAIASVVGLINAGAVLSARFPDPDDIMRLIQVRDLLGGQGWLDAHQYRVDAAGGPEAGGVLMHWSRLVDIPLALVIGALTPLIGSAAAETVALVLVPLLTLGIAMLLAARIVWKTLGDDPIAMTCIAMALSVPLLFQLAPMRIDHHGWQIVGGLVAVNGLLARRALLGGLVAGLAMAAWLSISLEGLPLAAAICALMAWRWWQDAARRDWLAWVMLGLAGGSVLAYFGTKDASGLLTYCDAIGPAHIAMFVWGAAVLGVLAWVNPSSRLVLLAGFGLAGAGAIAILMGLAPECAGSNFAQLDPVLIEFWYESVSEGLPIWHQNLDVALQIFVFPILGIYASYTLSRSTSGKQRQWWSEYTLLLIAAFLIAVLVARAGALAAALAAVPMGWQIRKWLMSIRVMDGTFARAGAMVALILALAPSLPFQVYSAVVPEDARRSDADMPVITAGNRASACDIASSAKLLAGLPMGEIYAPLDISPRLLLETPHSVIATGHHRGEKGMVFVIETALGSSEAAQAALQKRGTKYVALCPDLNEAMLYAQAKPDGFAADLTEGRAPEWLEPIAFGIETGFRAWRVKPD